jgi:predicted GTPase
MLNSKDQKIKIAVAGHTNVGKTTLIRTLMKTSVGKVSDSPNVTKRGETHYFDGLQADFIDTPGFQCAMAIAMYFESIENNPDYKISPALQKQLTYDKDALEALDDSDIVIYVASLSTVPDDNYSNEISVIKRKCSKIIGVINQYEKNVKATSLSEVENRIEQQGKRIKKNIKYLQNQCI